VGWEAATESWYWALTGLNKDAGFQVAAMAQIIEAGRYGLDAAFLAACSWYAVGVLPKVHPYVLLTAGQCVAPTPAPTPTPTPTPAPQIPSLANPCATHGNDIVCDPTVPSLAAVCNAGFVVGALACADSSLRCKPVSAVDPTATLDLDGALVCE
jgi:hypothetical protein